jgi:hypothetical protein
MQEENMESQQLAYRAGLVSLTGAFIQIVYGLLAIFFPYPRILDSQFEFLFLLANGAMLAGVIGFLALDVARPRWLALFGGALASLGYTIRMALSAMLIVRPATPGDGSTANLAIPISINFMFLGLALLGVSAVRGERLPGWQAWTPLLALAAGIVTAASFPIDKHLHFILLGLLGGVAWSLVGYVVFRRASNRNEATSPASGGATVMS